MPAAAGGAKAGGSPVDRFIGAKLAAKGLALAPEASREVLLRRLTLDLTGLPPTTAELDAFLADRAPDAYDRAVTRLLDSPRYGLIQTGSCPDIGQSHGRLATSAANTVPA